MSDHLGERLSALLDGEMSATDRAAAHSHIRDCAACARELEELASVDALVRELPVEAPAGYFDELPGRVRARIRARRRSRVAPAAVWAAAAAAVVMFAVVAPQALRRAPSIVPATAPVAPAPRAVVPEAPRTTPATSALEDRVASGPDAFAGREPAGRLLERDRVAKAVAVSPPPAFSVPLAADMAARDKVAADAAVPAPKAVRRPAATAPPPAPAPLAAPPAATAAQRPDGAFSQVQAEEKAGEAVSLDEAGAARPMAETRKEREAAAPARDGNLAGARYGRTADRRLRGEERYEMLLARRPTTADDARALGKAWEAFARDLPADRRADEARVRAIESAVTAWRLGGEPDDLASARAAAQAYLDTESAPQKDRVRALLETLP